jgi:hypothetical protein
LEIIEIQAGWGQPFHDTGQCRLGAADIQRRAQVGLQNREMVEYEQSVGEENPTAAYMDNVQGISSQC